jgi:hypothetical protein
MAQLDTGAIAGTILDPANKVVAGANVSLRGTDTGSVYTTVSSSTGYYVFPSVRTGSYDITVVATGFKTAVHQGVIVAVGTSSAVDIALVVGTTSETISVTSNTQTLDSDTSDIGVSIQPEQVEDLPLTVAGWRSLEALIYLAPGVAGYGMAGNGSDTLKINGGQEMGTDFLIDGITTNRQQNGSGSFGIVSPSVSAVSEFRVSISGMPAELGRTTGGVSNFNTKGGSNEYHGMTYDYFKNAALDANSWFNNGDIALFGNTPAIRQAYKRPADTKNDYGINLGGPIRIPHLYNGKDKTFFFFNWEQWRQNYGGPINSQLPTPAELGSDGQYFDFSSLLGTNALGTSPCGETVYPGEIMDPKYDNTSAPCRYAGFGQTVTGTPGNYVVTGAPTNKIPISRASTVAQNIVKTYLMPLAQQEISGSGSTNYVYRSPGVVTNTNYSFRIDQNIGERNKIWGFWSSRENTDSGGNSNMPPPGQACCGTVNQLGKYLRAGWDWIATPTIVNSLTIGGNRSNNINKSKAALMGTDWDQKLGLANGFSDDFPVFQFIGNTFPQFGQQEDSTDTDNTLALNDILHWQHGAHSLKVGVEGQYHQYSWVSRIGGTCEGNAGCAQFWDNQTASDENFWGQDGNSFAAFLIGEAGAMSNLNDLHAPRWISHYGAIFAQDDWKATPNLTFNLGVRWSYETPRREAAGDTSIWDPTMTDAATNAGEFPQALGALVFGGKGAGRNGSENETWGSVYKKNFEPRVGFAWEPDAFSHKAVIRGNAGIFSGPLVYADYGQGTVQGFTVQGSLFTADPLDGVPLDNGFAALPTTPDLNPNQLDGTNVAADFIAKSNGRPAMTETWSLQTEYQITANLFANVGYVGMHSTHLHAMLNFMNDMPDKDMALGDYLNWWAIAPGPAGWSGPAMEPYANFSCIGPNVTVAVPGCTWPEDEPESQALRPFPQIGYINMDSYLQNVGQSTYNALQVKLEQRFHDGLNVLASYTFSKTLTDADVIQPYWSTLQNGGAVQDPENLKGEKAVSSEDVPNNFVVSYVYELPIGKGKAFLGNTPKPVSAIISGWSTTGILRYTSGQPMSIYGATGIPGKNSSVRFNRVKGQPVKNPNYKNPLLFDNTSNATACETGYFNCAAFYDPNLASNRDAGATTPGGNPWRFGTMPRNSSDIRGFAYKTEDFGLAKNFSIVSTVKASLRWEVFDAFNRHEFLRPNSDLFGGNTGVGQIGGLQNGPRNMQVSLRITY